MATHNEINFESELCAYLEDSGWKYSKNDDGYDAKLALFPDDLKLWLQTTQPDEYKKTVDSTQSEAAQEKAFRSIMDRLVSVLEGVPADGGGTLNILRGGFKHRQSSFKVFQNRPNTLQNKVASDRYDKTILRVMRQVHYSPVERRKSIDLVFFVNGIPISTMEVKTDFTQNVSNAVTQYKQDRNTGKSTIDQYKDDHKTVSKGNKKEPLLTFGRGALVHFAVSNSEVFMTTNLDGENTRFLPFNKGNDGHSGNPSHPTSSPTAYMWEEVFQKDNILDIVGKFMHLEVEKRYSPVLDAEEKISTLLFPRYHQWDVVRKVIEDARVNGAGQKYLIQHSAGSGKTNSIAWTAYRLSNLHDDHGKKVFDTVIVLSDRTVLDGQLRKALLELERTDGTFKAIDPKTGSKSSALRDALAKGTKVIGVTIQTFPAVMAQLKDANAKGESHELGNLSGRKFAIIADEAHSSQSGDSAISVRRILNVTDEDQDEVDAEDIFTRSLAHAPNISYLAFTATPKAKTIEMFGRPGADGTPEVFHLYSMQQAIEEGFILDVLKNYVSYKLAFKLAHNGVEYDDSKASMAKSKAVKDIMQWVRLHPTNISQKVSLIVEHYRDNVAKLLGGKAKAMVVTGSRKEAVRYKLAIDAYISRQGYTDLATLVAFSGKVEDDDAGLEYPNELKTREGVYTEASMNKVQGDLAKAFKGDKYQIMLVANKYQTGFDQPLLSAMYVDKKLSGVNAVQTLSRLNRTAAGKEETFIVDFVNDPEDILKAFRVYHEEARLSDVTDPNVIHDLKSKLDNVRVYTAQDIENVFCVWGQNEHNALHASVQTVVDNFNARYDLAESTGDVDELEKLDKFRGNVSAFLSAYSFLSQIIDYSDSELEKSYIFYGLLNRVLDNKRRHADNSIDFKHIAMTHYELERQAKINLKLAENDAPEKLNPKKFGESKVTQDPEIAFLEDIIEHINEHFHGSGLEGRAPMSVTHGIVNKTLDNERLRGQAKSNDKDDFYTSPSLVRSVEDMMLSANDEFSKGIKFMLRPENRDKLVGLMKRVELYEKLREG